MNDRNSIDTKVEKTYKDLKVFNLSYDLGLQLHKVTLKFPDIEQYALAKQLRSSSKSIPVNIAEGMSKQASAAEVIRFLKMAIGSCEETKVWLSYSKDLNYIDSKSYDEFIINYDEVGKMLSGLVKYWNLKV